MQGTIVKGIAGFYYVKTQESIVECKARGKFRYNNLTPMVGDVVDIDNGRIEGILERKNYMIRPAVANITQAFVVFAVKSPEISVDLLNKFLVSCEYKNIKAIVCLNKIDLISEMDNTYKEVIDMVNKAGYEMISLNAKKGLGIDKIKNRLKGNTSVFCGASGVGKSTIINEVIGKEIMETGDLSTKTERGKNTTRCCELFDVCGGFVVDTPGFSSFNIDYIPKSEIEGCFPEFSEYIGKCKFNGCVHHKEPGCAVKNAVENNKISTLRYNFYIKILMKIGSEKSW